MEEIKKVALYIRVSSDEQKKEGLSIDAQLRKLKEYCAFKGWEIYKVYSDEGISAGSINKRHQFVELLEDSKQLKFSTLLIVKFDRAFRNVKDALITFDELKGRGIDFVSINEDIDTTTAMGKFFFVIISALAELERGLTADRNKSIMDDKFKRGIFPSKIPYGYKAVYKDKKLKKGVVGVTLHPKESEVVLDVFQMASNGYSYKEICAKHKLKPQSYYNILRNKVYYGVIEFGGEEKVGVHPPIILKEYFDGVN